MIVATRQVISGTMTLLSRFVTSRFLPPVSPAVALDRAWIGGSADWGDVGATANGNPADESDSDDRSDLHQC